MNSRRQILKLLGVAAPVATFGNASALAAELASPSVAAAAALGAGSFAQSAQPPQSYNLLGSVIGKQIERLKVRAEEEGYTIRNVRAGGLDADIACLRSTSSVYKARKQVERDMDHFLVLRAAQEMMWG